MVDPQTARGRQYVHDRPPRYCDATMGRKLRSLAAGLVGLMLAGMLVPSPAQGGDAPKITVIYVYTNPEGTPLARADADGNIIARYDYKPYGAPVAPVPGQLPAGPGYTGHVNDPGTGLVYMQQRYYDPEAGRFLSIDPVAPTPGNVFNFGRYTYANDNPIRYTDPDGRNVTAFIGGLFVETAHFATGQGFSGSNLIGALKDGYNGEGGGVLHAALEDAGTISAAAGVAGVVKGGAALVARFAAKQALKEGAEIGVSKGLGNPFKKKNAAEVEQMFKGKGFEPKGSDPVNGKGGYVNPKTGRSYHIDPKDQGKFREPNHVDANRPRDYSGPLEKKKLPYRDFL